MIMLSPETFAEIVTIALVTLTVLTALLTIAAVTTHVAEARRQNVRNRRWAKWTPALQGALVGDRETSSVPLLVKPIERGDYFQLLIAYAFRLGGDSHSRLAEAAAPHLPRGPRDAVPPSLGPSGDGCSSLWSSWGRRASQAPSDPPLRPVSCGFHDRGPQLGPVE